VKRLNLRSATTEYDADDPEGYRAGMNRFGPSIGAQTIGASIYELPEGQSICPYHYEYPNEEWLLVISGRPTLRDPDGEQELQPGDVVCFPEGPAGAHQVFNRGEDPLRVAMLSTLAAPSIAVYPDSDKIGVFDVPERDAVVVRRSSNVDYYDGELSNPPEG
jgi:uncharacterized cupin superfamily protein